MRYVFHRLDMRGKVAQARVTAEDLPVQRLAAETCQREAGRVKAMMLGMTTVHAGGRPRLSERPDTEYDIAGSSVFGSFQGTCWPLTGAVSQLRICYKWRAWVRQSLSFQPRLRILEVEVFVALDLLSSDQTGPWTN